MPHKPKIKPFLVLPLLESDLSDRPGSNCLEMPAKNPGLRLFTKTWPPSTKKKDSDENKRPLTATLEKPTVLDIRLISKIDMSKIRKEFLTITNLCRLPILLKNTKNSKQRRPLSLPPPAIEKKVKKTDVDEISIEEEESTRSVTVTGRHASKLKSISVKRAVKTCDDNNNTSSKTIRIPRSKNPTQPSDNKPIASHIDTKLIKLPQPCNSCRTCHQPERLHSHPVIANRAAVSSPKLLVKSTVQKPVAIKYKSSKSKKENSEQNPPATRKPSLPSQNIVHSNPSSANSNMLAARRLEIMKQMDEKNASRASSGKRTLTCYVCGREYGTASLKLHEPKCLEKWERENNSLPVHLKRKPPVRPNTATSSENWNELAWEASQASLVPCDNCGRTFYPDRLVVHQRSCKPSSPVVESKSSNQSLNNIRYTSSNNIALSDRPSSAAQGPSTARCHICGKIFVIHSLKVHEKQCMKKWMAENRSPTPSSQKGSPHVRKKDNVNESGSVNNSPARRDSQLSPRKAPLFPCYICKKQFSINSIYNHEPQCLKEWKAENDKLPLNKRKQQPLKPDIKFTLDVYRGRKRTEEPPERLWQDHFGQLVSCSQCSRTFNPDRIVIHEKSCKGS